MPESWIKAHVDLLCDPKILRLHPISRWAWIGLLLLARTGRPPGTWKATSGESAAGDLALALRLDDPLDDDAGPLVNGDFQKMLDEEMISISDDGLVTVLHWKERQGNLAPSGSPQQTRERQRLSRMSRHVTSVSQMSRQSRVVTTSDNVEENNQSSINELDTRMSRAVTSCHELSRQKRREEKRENPPTPLKGINRQQPDPGTAPGTAPSRPEPAPSPATALPCPDDAAEIPAVDAPCPQCMTALRLLNELTCRAYPAAPRGMDRLHACHGRHGLQPVLAVIRDKVQEWGSDAKMHRHLTPQTLFEAERFSVYVNALSGPVRDRSAPAVRLASQDSPYEEPK